MATRDGSDVRRKPQEISNQIRTSMSTPDTVSPGHYSSSTTSTSCSVPTSSASLSSLQGLQKVNSTIVVGNDVTSTTASSCVPTSVSMQSSRLPASSSSSSTSLSSSDSFSKTSTNSSGTVSKWATQTGQQRTCLSSQSDALGAIYSKKQELEDLSDVPLDLSKNVTKTDVEKILPSRLSLLSTQKSIHSEQHLVKDGKIDNFGFLNLIQDEKQPVELKSVGRDSPSSSSIAKTEQFSEVCTTGLSVGSGTTIDNVSASRKHVTNSPFQNYYQNMGKRKMDDIVVPGTPDSEKQNSNSASSSPSVGLLRNFSSKKKCSIENIVARIRTEKTVSETSNSKVVKCLDSTAKIDKELEIKEEVTCDKTEENTAGLVRQLEQNVCKKDLPKADKNNEINEGLNSVLDTRVISKVACNNIKEEFDTNMVDSISKSAENGAITHSDRSIQLTDANQILVTKLDGSVISLEELQKKSNATTFNKDLEGHNPKKRFNSNISKQDEMSPKKKRKLQSDAKTKSKNNEKSTKFTVDKNKNISDSEGQNTSQTKTESTGQNPKSPTKTTMSNEQEGKLSKLSPKKKTFVDKSEKHDDDVHKTTKGSVNSKIEISTKENSKSGPESNQKKVKDKDARSKTSKLSIACHRVKREASLNAATLVNILCEKAPRTSKLASKRSKSESDISKTPECKLLPTVSVSDIGFEENLLSRDKAFKSPKKTKSENHGKSGSPRRKVSFTDDIYEEVFEAVIQRGLREYEGNGDKNDKESLKKKNYLSRKKQDELLKKKTQKESLLKKSKAIVKTNSKDKSLRLEKIRKAIQLTVNTRSPEEKEEVKRKASLARLARAKDLLKTKKKLSAEYSDKDVESDSESVSSETVDVEADTSTDADTDTVKPTKTKKGALCRSARTHVSVESKSVVENTMPSPRWCECCQSTYYPSQPSQGAQVWRIKQLVDKGTSKSPEPIQTSSHHFIAAHASCEVRPYASPSHVSMLDSSPYMGQMGQIVPHGHIQCSACHSGMFHASCQNCTLMSCQRYGSTYSVSYPHSHGSYIHCGCGSCYSSGSFHHTVGQTLIHQPSMPITTESPLLLHHPLQLQVAHDTSHPPVSMATLAHGHTEPPGMGHQMSVPASLASESTRIQSSIHGTVPQCCQGDQNSFSRMCQLSQGEVTNVSVLASSSPTHSDHEFVDVGSRDDFLKSVAFAHSEQKSSSGHNVIQSISSVKKKHLETDTFKRKKGKDSINVTKKKFVKTLSSADKEKKKKKLELLKQKAENLLSLKNKGDKVKIKDTSVKSPKTKTKSNVMKDGEKDATDQTKEVKRPWHGWSWMGDGVVKSVTNIFDGQPIKRKCYTGIVHEDGDSVQVKDCVLVCAGRRDRDLPFIAKVTSFWEEKGTGEMMMSVLWYYRPEHAEGGRRPEHLENEVFAAKHRDETGIACIEDKGYVLTYNEYCRYMAEVERVKYNLPPRKAVVPAPEEPYPENKIPPVDADPETVFLCRQVYDIKLKRVLKNPS